LKVGKDYQIRMETKLNELVTRIDELKEQADNLDSEKQEELRQELTKMEARTKATRKKLQELKRGEYEAQRILKTYLEHSLDDLKNQLDMDLLPYF
jgi:hypothetical protein